MSGWRNGRESAIKQNPPVFPHRGARIGLNWLGASANEDNDTLFSHSLWALSRRLVPMSLNRPNDVRGRAIRRALLAIVHARYAAGLPLPSNAAMGAALGLSASQVSRHMNVLMDQGAFTVRCHGMHTRIELEDAA